MTGSLDHESEWWGNCVNTWSAEWSQIEYAKRMGLPIDHDRGHYPSWDLGGKSVLDIGGGPASMLLKARNAGNMTVLDPCPYPEWVAARYEAAGIEYVVQSGEGFRSDQQYDECWVYNVLQHVVDPGEILKVARRSAKVLRIFEWIGIEGDEMHPHVLTQEDLDRWCGGRGRIEEGVDRVWNGPEVQGNYAYYGIFSD